MNRESGFTLVELLVVMVLLGLIAALLFGGLSFTARTAARGTASLDRASDEALAADFLRAALADARPLPADGDSAIVFAGRSDAVDLVEAAPPQLARGGYYRVSIALDRDAHALLARWTPLSRDGADPRGAPPPSTLLDQVGAAQFAYFGVRADETAPSWHAAWQDQRALPRLVRLRLSFTDSMEAPDLVVAVRTAGAAP